MAESVNSGSTINASSLSSSNSSTPILPHNHPISVKLSESNFLIWRQHVLATVRGYGLEHFLTGDYDIPPKVITSAQTSVEKENPEYLSWHRQDQLLAAWIQGSLSESIMISVVGLDASRDIWRAWETSFSSQSKAKVMQYKLQLQTLKKENLCMRDYLNKVKTCCDLLGSAGCRILEEDQILHILAGLSAEYDPVMVTITSRSDGWTIQDVSALLHSFESRLESAKSHSSASFDGSQPSAHLIHSGAPRRDGNQHNRNSYNSSKGEGSRGNRGGCGGRGGRTGNRLVCQVCQKPGHSADRCWHRFEQGYAPQPSQRAAHSTQQSHGYQPHIQQSGFHSDPSAHMALARGSPSFIASSHSHPSSCPAPSECSYQGSHSTAWYPDSGATNHVSSDLSNLNSSSEYFGSTGLKLGDGYGVKISHVGHSFVKSSPFAHSRTLLLNNL